MTKKVYITIFFIICLIPSLLMLVLGPSSSGANEILSGAPKMGIDVLSETSDFIGDRFALRKELISCWSWISARVFRTSSDDQIILGRGGTLYYSSDLDDYTGSHLSPAELETIASNLEKIQTDVESRGGEFIFTIAPNKSSVHGEDMPVYITEDHENSNAVLLMPYLEKHGINYVNLFDKDIPYYATDSHWNGRGAAMAADALMGTDFSSGSFVTGEKIYKGDLYDMLYPSFKGCESAVEYGGVLDYETDGPVNGGNAITITTTGGGDKTLYCWRDSFGISLYPYLAAATKEATFSRSTKFDAENCADADIVILEIVERNIDYLL